MSNVIEEFVKINLPTVWRVAEENALSFSSIASAYGKEVDEQGYPLYSKLLKFRRGGSATWEGFELSEDDVKRIEAELTSHAVKWPVEAELDRIEDGGALPDHFAAIWDKAPSEYKCIVRNKAGKIIQLVVREDTEKGKRFPPIVPMQFDNGSVTWVSGQHSSNPLVGVEMLKGADAAIIVEGFKTRNKILEIQEGKTEWAKNHPFAEQLKSMVVLAFLNGAHAARLADWEPLNRSGVLIVHYAPDCDAQGRLSIPAVSKAVRKPMVTIEFDATFEKSWDLADDTPQVHMNREGRYIGPDWASFLRPATYLADLVTVGDTKKMMAVLRPHVVDEWAYLKSAKLFVHKRFNLEYTYDEINTNLAPFSPVADVARLMLKQTPLGYVDGFTFLPGKAPSSRSGLSDRLIVVDGKTRVNKFVPPRYEVKKGDISVFLDYLNHLVPDDQERKHLIEWAGTLIAKPNVRLKYGVLITSEQHGTGKSIFGEKVLRPLVGSDYVSMPNETDVLSEFNDWVYCKRLAIFEELYSSTSKATYNKLKNPLTANVIGYRTLYRAPITIENCCTLYAPSNDKRPLRLDQADRRFLCISATEKKWGAENFGRLIEFLDNGGMPAVAYFFHNLEAFGFNYVTNSAEAPSTTAKVELLEESLSDARQLFKTFCEELSESKTPICTTAEWLKSWAEGRTKQTVYEKPKGIKQFCISNGLRAFDDSTKRITVDSYPSTPIFNIAMERKLSGQWPQDQRLLKDSVNRPWHFFDEEQKEAA